MCHTCTAIKSLHFSSISEFSIFERFHYARSLFKILIYETCFLVYLDINATLVCSRFIATALTIAKIGNF